MTGKNNQQETRNLPVIFFKRNKRQGKRIQPKKHNNKKNLGF